MVPSEKELHGIRDRMLPSRKAAFRVLQRMTDEGHVPASVYAGLFNPDLAAGSVELQLGNVLVARKWFAESALAMVMSFSLIQQHHEEIGKGAYLDLPIYAERALRSALLSADPRVVGGVTDEILTLDETYVTRYYGEMTRYYHCRGLAYLLRGNQNQAEAAVSNLEKAVERTDQYLATELAKAYAGALNGLIDDDTQLVQNGVDSMAAYHRRYHTGDGFKDIVDHRTCSYLVFAHHRGVNVHVDNEYVPAEIYDIEWGSVELPKDTPDALWDLYENADAVA